ncbi:hypothetical protein T492DRAFT_583601 [Pavlovales sp. CCMP2436]|nr:hypothetical protein T492DRAFT_583601 [Pavlovales sp. CCMP2436]
MPGALLAILLGTQQPGASGLRRVATQFIAAIGDPSFKSGGGADAWGIWRVDPGPRGVPLRDWPQLAAAGGRARTGWQFDPYDFWVEEYGRIMPNPDFPLPAGRYAVTGDREITTVLTVRSSGEWELADGTLHDVTHLPCRAARYAPVAKGASPGSAHLADFPVAPGGPMPAISGCTHKDYAVIFVIAIEDK